MKCGNKIYVGLSRSLATSYPGIHWFKSNKLVSEFKERDSLCKYKSTTSGWVHVNIQSYYSYYPTVRY